MSMLFRGIALILFSLVYIIGLIGNGLLIFIILRQKHLRTVPNILVVSLAFGDFLFVLFCVPFGAVAYSLEYYPFSTFYCRFENLIINVSLGVSIFSLLALSADRYKIISKPFSSHAKDPSIKLRTVVILIWLGSILLALPETIYSGLITETRNQSNVTVSLNYCWSPNLNSLVTNRTFMFTRQILRLIIYYLMPLIFISIFYSLIARTLFNTNAIRNYENSSRMNHMNTPFHQNIRLRKQLRARQKVAKTVLFLCLVFFLCWLPKQLHDLYWFIGVLVYSSNWNLFWQINKTIALMLTYIYSCINPFALYFLSSTFRHFYKRYLCFWRNRTRSRNHPQNQHVLVHHSSLNHTHTTNFYELPRLKT